MAVFGSLDELPIPEVLTMLGKRSGKLKVWGLPSQRSYDLHIYESRLKGFYVDEQMVSDVIFVRDSMIELINADEGSFEFERHPPDSLAKGLDVPIEQLLLSTATAIDELQAYRQRFADKRTRFRSSGPSDVWLDENLYEFWHHSASLLEQGASAEEIAMQLAMNIEQVQLNLYKLRSLGKISPVRAFSQKQVRQRREAAAARDAQRDVKKTEERALRSTVIWHDDTPSPESNANEARAADKKPENDPTEDSGLISRLLKALSFGRRS